MANPTPTLISDHVYEWLDNALDFGISEHDFWNMTLAELERVFKSKRRVQKQQEQQRAAYDYLLADLIGKSISRLYSESAKFPELYEAYPQLFDGSEIEQQKQEKRMELSALRFRQFAEQHNKQYHGGATSE